MKKNVLFSILIIGFSFIASHAQPILVTPSTNFGNFDPSVYLENSATQVSNLSYVGDPLAYGRFSNSDTSFSLNYGLILTSGKATNAQGPNNSGAISYNNTGPSSELLNALIPQTTNDASILEFDIVSCDSVYKLSVVFGSDEYLEWVGTSFNDVFAIFISGPNPNSAYPDYNNQNIALIPGTLIPISINNINNVANTMYYVNNGTGSSPSNQALQYDGYTTAITCRKPIIPGEVYHIVIAIADAGDSILDSGVLFRALQTGLNLDNFSMSIQSPYGLSNQLFEGYPANLLVEKLDSVNLNNYLKVAMNYSGTAVSAIDYAALPDTIVVPPGQMSVTLPINVFADSLAEGIENLLIQTGFSCPYNSKFIDAEISDSYQLIGGIEPEVIHNCNNGPVYIEATANAADSMLTYLWSNGSTTNNMVVAQAGGFSQYYSVTISHSDGFTITDSVLVNHSALMEVQVELFPDTCSPDSVSVNVNGGYPPYSFSWNTGFTTQNVSGLSNGPYSLTVTDVFGCTAISDFEVNSPGLFTHSITGYSYCDSSLGYLIASAYFGTGPYSFEWATGETTNQLDSVVAGNYYVTISGSNGCQVSDSIINFNPLPFSASLLHQDISCVPGHADLTFDSANHPVQISWSTGETSNQITIPTPGPYSVSVVDSYGCELYEQFNIAIDSTFYVDVIDSIFYNYCDNLPVNIEIYVLSGLPPYTFNWSNGSTNEDVYDLPYGEYFLTVTDVYSCFSVRDFNLPGPGALSAEIIPLNVTDCHNLDNGSALCSVIGGTAPYSFLWSNGDTTATADSLQPGMYYLTIQDACNHVLVDSIQLEYEYAVDYNVVVTDASYADPLGSIEVNFNPPSQFGTAQVQNLSSLQILNSGFQNANWNLSPGSYLLSIMDSFQCIDTSYVNIGYQSNIVPATDTMILVNCPGDSVLLFTNLLTNPDFGNDFYYDVALLPLTYEDTTLGVSVPGIHVDNAYFGPFPLGFDFDFFGDSYNEFYVGSNGWISFQPLSDPSYDPWETQAIPNPDPTHPRCCIMAAYRDWDLSQGGNVKYYTTGVAPNRKLVISFIQIPLHGIISSFSSSFQIVLQESTNYIFMNHLLVDTYPYWNNGNGVIGIQNDSGTIAYLYDQAYNNTYFMTGNSSYRYSPIHLNWYDPDSNFIGSGNQVSFVPLVGGTYTGHLQSPYGNEEINFHLYLDEVIQTLDLGPEIEICPYGSGYLQMPLGYAYQWSTGETTNPISIDQAGDYFVTVSTEFCMLQDSIAVSFENMEFDLFFDSEICQGDTAWIVCDSMFSYEWENGNTSNVFLTSSSGFFYVTVSSATCTVADTVEINLTLLPLPVGILPSDTTKCPGQNLALDGGNYPFYDYYWSNGYNNDYTIIDSVGLYTLTLIDTFGCVTIDSVWVTNQLLVNSSFQFFETNNHVQFQNQSQNAYWFSWDFGDGSPISTEANPEHDYPVLNQNMWYTATLVSANQCGSDTSSMQIFTFDIEEMDGESLIQIFPNPNKGKFFLLGSLESKDDLSIQIFNSIGEPTFNKKISSLERSISEEIKMGKVAPGIYFLKIQQKEKSWVWKMVVE
ncbi:MAG: choice-of-anchor L domain-containing protein [Bacteroidales bacterium]|nr:choice-of-anchor L domain-containing protein [Bacteroidales bacterium]MCF8455221.1 choice-of-anchor L domain-containing protein [Bacteroidales bacterium]